MPDLLNIRFGEIPFSEAIASLRALAPMTDEEFYALSAAARNKAFSFSGAASRDAAEKVRRILQDAMIDPVRGDFMERANAALDAYGISLTPFQAQTIFDTNISRAFNDGKWRELQAPEIASAFPYVGVDTAADTRVRHNHYALDWRRIKTVFPINDFLWTQMAPPFGFNCRCTIRNFSVADVQQMGLTVGRGEEWYGRSVEVTTPKGDTRVVQVLPDPGFSSGALTAREVIHLAVITASMSAAQQERIAA